jgi:hypothetical protein
MEMSVNEWSRYNTQRIELFYHIHTVFKRSGNIEPALKCKTRRFHSFKVPLPTHTMLPPKKENAQDRGRSLQLWHHYMRRGTNIYADKRHYSEADISGKGVTRNPIWDLRSDTMSGQGNSSN